MYLDDRVFRTASPVQASEVEVQKQKRPQLKRGGLPADLRAPLLQIKPTMAPVTRAQLKLGATLSCRTHLGHLIPGLPLTGCSWGAAWVRDEACGKWEVSVHLAFGILATVGPLLGQAAPVGLADTCSSF